MPKTRDIINFLRSIDMMDFHYEFLNSQLVPNLGLRNLRRYLKYLNNGGAYVCYQLPEQIATVLYFIVKEGGVKADKDFFDYAIAIIHQHLEPWQYGHNMYDLVDKVVLKMNSFSANFSFSTEGMYYDEGRFYLSWEYIEFNDSQVLFRHPSHIHNVFAYQTQKSKSVYNTIEKSFFEKLPSIYVNSTCGKIVDILSFVELNKCLDLIATKYNYPNLTMTDIEKIVRNNPVPRLIPRVQKFGEKDSYYLTFLQALTNGSQYECTEVRTTYTSSSIEREKAYLFTHTFKNGNHFIAYENNNIDNSTIIFLVEKEAKEIAIEAIIDYFQSYRRNKREALMYSYNIFRNYGVMTTKRIMHTDQVNWAASIANEMSKII